MISLLLSKWKAGVALAVLVLLGLYIGGLNVRNAHTLSKLKAAEAQLQAVTAEAAGYHKQLDQLAAQTEALKADLSVAKAASEKVRVVTKTRIQRIVSKPLPSDCKELGPAINERLNKLWGDQ